MDLSNILLGIFLQKKVGEPCEIHADLGRSVLNIVWHMFAGERFETDDPFLSSMVVALDRTSNLIDQAGFLNFAPLLQ